MSGAVRQTELSWDMEFGGNGPHPPTAELSFAVEGTEPEPPFLLGLGKACSSPGPVSPPPSTVPKKPLGVAICLYNPLKLRFGTPLL